MADEKPADEAAKFAVSDEELRESYSGPAVLSNRVLITKNTTGVRLSFMEQQVGKIAPVFRTAAALAYGDAIALKDLLIYQLKDVEEQIKTAASKTIEAEKKPEEGSK